MGAQSTAFSHLSEESMLLGADGDSFDADQVEVPAYTRDVHDTLQGLVRQASFDSDRYEREGLDKYSSRTRGYNLTLDDDPELQHSRIQTSDENSPPISYLHQAAEPTVGFQRSKTMQHLGPSLGTLVTHSKLRSSRSWTVTCWSIR